MFRRRRRDEAADQDDLEPTAEGADEDQAATGVDEDEEPAGGDVPAQVAREGGPFDAGDLESPETGRIDLGGVLVPAREGLELRVEADQSTGVVVAVTMLLEDSALQIQPFAAPRTEGIWDEVRREIRAGITQQGGTADEVEGPFGSELHTRVPVRRQDGTSGVEPARFLGVDGPRWFLRGVLTGRAAVEQRADAALLELFRDVVVVRGASPMAPRDPIPLRLPSDAGVDPAAGPQGGGDDPLNPFQRGPEITEIH